MHRWSMRLAAALGLAVSGCVLGATAARVEAAGERGGNWPGWQGPNRDNKSSDTGLLDKWPEAGPKRLWKADGLGEGYSSVAVANGTVYITGAVDRKLVVFAFDSRGRKKWDTTVGPEWTASYPGSRATPTIDGERLYILSGTGTIACLDTDNGRKVWAHEMKEFGGSPHGWGYAESPLVARKLCIVTPGGHNGMVALDKVTGQTVWMSKANGAPPNYSSAILVFLDKMPMVIGANGGGLFAVHPSDGRVLWTNNFADGNTANCPTPAYADGYVVWAAGYRKGGICLQLTVDGKGMKAEEAWRTNELDCHHGGFVIVDGYIYGNHSDGWVCLALDSGKRMWSDRGVGKGSLTFADGKLFLFGEDGGRVGLARATPDGFTMGGEFRVEGKGPSWAHPVVTGGRLYLRYGDNLYCYDVRQ